MRRRSRTSTVVPGWQWNFKKVILSARKTEWLVSSHEQVSKPEIQSFPTGNNVALSRSDFCTLSSGLDRSPFPFRRSVRPRHHLRLDSGRMALSRRDNGALQSSHCRLAPQRLYEPIWSLQPSRKQLRGAKRIPATFTLNDSIANFQKDRRFRSNPCHSWRPGWVFIQKIIQKYLQNKQKHENWCKLM